MTTPTLVKERMEALEPTSFTLSTTDRPVDEAVMKVVHGVLRAYLRGHLPRYVVGPEQVREADQDQALAADYHAMADEMLAVARDARAAQIRAIRAE